MSTQGFYIISQEEPKYMIMGPNYVIGPDFELQSSLKDTYIYPVNGWYWFDSEEEACTFFSLPYPPEIPTMGMPIQPTEQITE
jgi:hypothetical protein